MSGRYLRRLVARVFGPECAYPGPALASVEASIGEEAIG